MTSILLQGAVLYLAVSDMTGIAVVWVLVHAVLAVIEGFLTGGIVDFLYRVKPELLGLTAEPDERPTVESSIDDRIPARPAHSVVGSGNTSSSDTSH